MLVLSANKTGIAFLFMITGKSFTYKRNSVGPSTEPCGTPCLIVAQFETALLQFFFYYLLGLTGIYL
jgi:hypothetical protein